MYTLKYVKSFEWEKRTFSVGDRWAWHDISLEQWYWFLSAFFKEDGTLIKYSLDYEAAADFHYEFTNEAAVCNDIYQPGDERLLFDEILIRYAARYGGDALYSLIRPYITAQFHFD